MKLNIRKGLSAMVIAGSIFSASAGDFEINHLGTNHTLVRVKGDGKYALFPIQESNDDARVKLLVDGKLEKTFYVRLAKSKVDYTMPFDLSPYKGRNVIFDVRTDQSRSDMREAKDDACWNSFALSDTLDTKNVEKHRPLFHHTPQYGWMNDPNGMFYKDGEWHLYYQWNPYGSKWQNMTWGHSSSKDLVNWTHHPAAIEPNGLGTVFSGSSAVDTENSAGFGKDAVLAMYTSAGTSQMQSLAVSKDNGMTFDIYPGNPVITLESEARDPNMFWNPDTKLWNMILAHPLEHEMLIFTSPNMVDWTIQSSFGKGLGAQNGVWECPDLFELPVEGTDMKKWVLICNINPGGPFGGSAVQYFIGDFDGKKFTVDTLPDGTVPTKWLDYGKDNYALVSWSDAPDGRHTAIGWMSNWQYAAEVPTIQFRSANTLPRGIGLFKGPDGQIYASSAPTPELIGLRGGLTTDSKKITLNAKGKTFKLPTKNDGICEILMNTEPDDAYEVEITLSNVKEEKVIMTYDPKNASFSFDRNQSGMTDFSQDFPAVTVSPTFSGEKLLNLRIYVDRSSIEVFGNDGRFVVTNLVFPTEPYSTLSISAKGKGALVKDLKIYSLEIK